MISINRAESQANSNADLPMYATVTPSIFEMTDEPLVFYGNKKRHKRSSSFTNKRPNIGGRSLRPQSALSRPKKKV